MVTSVVDENDERANILTLTEKGAKALERSVAVLAEVEVKLMRRISPIDNLGFQRVLQAIVGEIS